MSATPPIVDRKLLDDLKAVLDTATREALEEVVEAVVDAKRKGGRVVVVTGSGPNIHEGVTTLIAELIRLGVVHGVTTSSAVVAHEMGGVLDRVKRVNGRSLGLPVAYLPKGDYFELSQVDDGTLQEIDRHLGIDWALVERIREEPGEEIIKAAGNLGYPMGLWIEWLAEICLERARHRRSPFEEVIGRYCDRRTMLGAGAEHGVEVLVTVPQLIGGGAVGLAVGDSISIAERCRRIARLLDSADVIIESAVVLTQEIHDGPFETYTGHGIWAAWQGKETFSLKGKRLVRIDLDPVLYEVWSAERQGRAVQAAINQGRPKTKAFGVPFRMEMSGFARLEGSIPLIGDIGVIWPVLADAVARRLGRELHFISYPQETSQGKQMRDWIVREIRPLDWERLMLEER